MTDEELAELRALQARAYGADGGLLGAELARLRDLERLHRVIRGRPALPRPEALDERPSTGSGTGGGGSGLSLPELVEGEAVSSAHRSSRMGPSTGSGSGEAGAGTGEAGSGTGAYEDTVATSRVAAHRRRTAVVASVVGAALLLAGIGIGAALFGRTATAVELTAEQQELQQLIIDDGEFDAGSMRAIGTADGAALWLASQRDGDTLCLIVGEGLNWSSGCSPAEEAHDVGLFSGHRIEPDDDGDTAEVIHASVQFTKDGEPALMYQRVSDHGGPGRFFADAQEEADFDALVEHGFAADSLWVVGAYREHTIWMGQHESHGSCIAYPTDEEPALGCGETDAFGSMELVVPVIDTTSGTHLEVTLAYRIDAAGRQGLVINERPAEQILVEVETGQSIGSGDQVDIQDGPPRP